MKAVEESPQHESSKACQLDTCNSYVNRRCYFECRFLNAFIYLYICFCSYSNRCESSPGLKLRDKERRHFINYFPKMLRHEHVLKLQYKSDQDMKYLSKI